MKARVCIVLPLSLSLSFFLSLFLSFSLRHKSTTYKDIAIGYIIFTTTTNELQ